MIVKEYKLFKNENRCPEIKVKREFEYDGDTIETQEELYDLMQQMFGTGELFVEHSYLVAFDMGRELIGVVELAHGGYNCVNVSLKELFICALLLGAYEMVTIHNHPTNVLEASVADINMKNMIQEYCNLMDIKHLDNIIITKNGYLSLLNDDSE